MEFEAIASVIVGGCSWTLANGNPWGTLVGVGDHRRLEKWSERPWGSTRGSSGGVGAS